MPDENLTFDAWCGRVDAIAKRYDYVGSLTTQTGSESWRNYYEDGFTPEEAFIEDSKSN